ncbi:MAG: hypothetical protein R3F59_00095 [Myxococcota bacterium]
MEASWRWVFALPIGLAAVALALTRWIPPSPPEDTAPLDLVGAALAIAALGGVSYGLVEGGTGADAVAALALGLGAGVALAAVERRRPHAMIPVALFARRVPRRQRRHPAGLRRARRRVPAPVGAAAGHGRLAPGGGRRRAAARHRADARPVPRRRHAGPAHRPPLALTVGPLGMAAGALLFRRVGADATFLADVLPGTLAFGLGLVACVAPVTAAALGAAPEAQAGAASGTNNAVARTGQLLAVAAIPPAVGLGGDALSDPARLAAAFPTAMLAVAGLMVLGGAAGFALLRTRDREDGGRPIRAGRASSGPEGACGDGGG